jgi:hypothetical protein
LAVTSYLKAIVEHLVDHAVIPGGSVLATGFGVEIDDTSTSVAEPEMF